MNVYCSSNSQITSESLLCSRYSVYNLSLSFVWFACQISPSSDIFCCCFGSFLILLPGIYLFFIILSFFFFISEVICLPLNSKDQMRRMQRRVVLFWRLFAPHSWSYLLWFTVCLKRYFGKFRSTRITLISVSLPPTLEWQGNSGGKLKKPSFAIWTRNQITCESPPMPPPPPCRSFLIMFFMKRIRLTDELWVNAVSTMQSYTPDLN